MEELRNEVGIAPLLDPREIENIKPLEEVTSISIHPSHTDQHVMIGIELTAELRDSLIELFKRNYDICLPGHKAWSLV